MSNENLPVEEMLEEPRYYDMMDLFEELSFKEKWARVFAGLKQPKDTGEYKWAKLQMIRLSAPAAAVMVPIISIFLLALLSILAPPPESKVQVQVIDPEPIEEKLEEIKEELFEPPEPPEPIEVDTDVISDSPYVGEDATAVPGPVADFSPVPATFDAVAIVKSPVIMKGIYGARTGAARGSALAGGGGGSATEQAVLRALRWMKTKQNSDGSWPMVRPAMTAMALLCYLAHGETPASDEFGLTVELALKFLIESQDAAGLFKGRDPNNYTQPIVAYALAEAYGLTQVPDVKYAAEKAVNVVIKGQHPNGGWDYRMAQTDRDDTSVMGWCAQALKAAELAELDCPGLAQACKKSNDGFIVNASGGYESCGFGYTSPAKSGLTAVGALCMTLHGAAKTDQVIGAHKFMETEKWDAKIVDSKWGQSALYYFYYATQAKFYAGGDIWNRWNKIFSPELVKSQKVIPKEQSGYTDHKGRPWSIGYWDQYTGQGANNEIFGTTMCCLQLEVYYRYLPSFKVSIKDLEAAPVQKEKKDVEIDIQF